MNALKTQSKELTLIGKYICRVKCLSSIENFMFYDVPTSSFTIFSYKAKAPRW